MSRERVQGIRADTHMLRRTRSDAMHESAIHENESNNDVEKCYENNDTIFRTVKYYREKY